MKWLLEGMIRADPDPSNPPYEYGMGAGEGGTTGHFRETSDAYLLFKNGTILNTITSTKSIHKEKSTTATINAKKNIYIIFACYVQRVGYLRF